MTLSFLVIIGAEGIEENLNLEKKKREKCATSPGFECMCFCCLLMSTSIDRHHIWYIGCSTRRQKNYVISPT
jgi:hypothetical protein